MRPLLVLVSAVVFVDALLFGALAPLVPGYAAEFDLTKTSAGFLVAAFGAGGLLGALPGGLLTLRIGARRTVVIGLLLLTVGSLTFALAGGPWALGIARFVQGFASTTTWAGALAWLTIAAPRGKRGQTLGTAFGVAVLGAILGPMFGAVAHEVGVRAAFGAVAAVGLVLAAWAATRPDSRREHQPAGALRRALLDRRFLGGLWLNVLPAFLFGILTLLAPLRLDEAGYTAFAIAAVFLTAGLVEVVLNPLVGRYSDRAGRLAPTRIALLAAIVVSVGLALSERALVVAALVCLSALAFSGFYTPGMALVSDRAELTGLSQGIAFGIMNTAWSIGTLAGPGLGGALAHAGGDAATFLLAALLSGATLLAVERVARERRRPSLGAPA